jgi:hypothetical protein
LPDLIGKGRRFDFNDTRWNDNFIQRGIRKRFTADVLQLRPRGKVTLLHNSSLPKNVPCSKAQIPMQEYRGRLQEMEFVAGDKSLKSLF